MSVEKNFFTPVKFLLLLYICVFIWCRSLASEQDKDINGDIMFNLERHSSDIIRRGKKQSWYIFSLSSPSPPDTVLYFDVKGEVISSETYYIQSLFKLIKLMTELSYSSQVLILSNLCSNEENYRQHLLVRHKKWNSLNYLIKAVDSSEVDPSIGHPSYNTNLRFGKWAEQLDDSLQNLFIYSNKTVDLNTQVFSPKSGCVVIKMGFSFSSLFSLKLQYLDGRLQLTRLKSSNSSPIVLLDKKCFKYKISESLHGEKEEEKIETEEEEEKEEEEEEEKEEEKEEEIEVLEELQELYEEEQERLQEQEQAYNGETRRLDRLKITTNWIRLERVETIEKLQRKNLRKNHSLERVVEEETQLQTRKENSIGSEDRWVKRMRRLNNCEKRCKRREERLDRKTERLKRQWERAIWLRSEEIQLESAKHQEERGEIRRKLRLVVRDEMIEKEDSKKETEQEYMTRDVELQNNEKKEIIVRIKKKIEMIEERYSHKLQDQEKYIRRLAKLESRFRFEKSIRIAREKARIRRMAQLTQEHNNRYNKSYKENT